MKNEEEEQGASEVVRSQTISVIDDAITTRCIVVNGRRHMHTSDRITTNDLVRIAYPNAVGLERSAMTVAYDDGPPEARSGLLPVHASTPVTEGQSFSVSLTDKS